jgi:flagellar motor component MotA
MLTKISMLIKILSISVAVLLLFTITSTYTSRVVIYPVSAQMDNNSSNNNNNNNVTKSTMDLAMSELARIHLMAANEALMKGNTTFSNEPRVSAIVNARNERYGYNE